MVEKTLKRGNEIQEAIKKKRKAIDDITGILKNRKLAFHKMYLYSSIELSRNMPYSLDLTEVQPELDQALQNAQVRLHQEILKLEKEFEEL